MLNAKAFANATTVVTAAFYVVCWILSAITPSFVFSMAESWMHSINLSSLKSAAPMPMGTVILGLISLSVLTWITIYATIWLYNQWAKK